jgi:glycosyltransferase involved in cell wall biosynthesis
VQVSAQCLFYLPDADFKDMLVPPLKVSIVTVCYNAAATIRKCIGSVISQDYPHLEYLIIDGASTDGTLQIINEYGEHMAKVVSEPDRGIYDAMNKGIAQATGDVVGILNADDFLVTSQAISKVAEAFVQSGADIVYGNLNYVNPQEKIIRRWRSGSYNAGAFGWGWMPPHPVFYARRSLFERLGNYRLDYGSAADYELMLRFIHRHPLQVYYLDMTLVHMLTGGASNKSLAARVKAYRYDYLAMQQNGIRFPYLTILFKPLRKIPQYLP